MEILKPPTHSPLSDITEEAGKLGFIAVGFSRPGKPLFFDRFCEWIAAGKHGGMVWLGKHLDLREDPSKLLEGCRSVITLAYPYSSGKPFTPDGFNAARYTEPGQIDYHDRLRKLARRLSRKLMGLYPGSSTRVCVDSAPILERSFAHASGIGFIGKNNMLIVPGYGSYVFLAEILTSVSLPFTESGPMENRCGSCSLCVDSCPTGALERPFSLNASKCLSYLTIEHNGPITGDTGKKMGACFFGCDVCQEVCPLNKKMPRKEVSLPATDRILSMEPEDFEEEFGKTAFARSGLEKIKGNIRAIRSAGYFLTGWTG